MCIKTKSQLKNRKAWPRRCTWCAQQTCMQPHVYLAGPQTRMIWRVKQSKVQCINQIENGHIFGLFFILSFILELTNTELLCPLEESDTRTTSKSSSPSKGEAGREGRDGQHGIGVWVQKWLEIAVLRVHSKRWLTVQNYRAASADSSIDESRRTSPHGRSTPTQPTCCSALCVLPSLPSQMAEGLS